MNVKPILGLRAKISVKGSGKWEESGGDKAKFGLSITEILNSIHFLRQHNLIDCVKLFHFHIGSQVTQIQTIKDAITEGARIYAKLIKQEVPIEYFDVGGGLGVDYDGSQSTANSSRNYRKGQYISDVVYGIQQICDVEKVAHPHIISESGRALTAHHSCIITQVIGEIDPYAFQYNTAPSEKDHLLVKNIRDALEDLSEKNVQEIYNDALLIKEDSVNAFKLGVLSLEERAKIESLFGKISKKIASIIKDMDFLPEDLEDFEEEVSKQYLCNFSIFQSLPDVWAIKQIIPAIPITRLNEQPTEKCTLVDITCDSDGKIDRFTDKGECARSINLHKLTRDRKYYMGFFSNWCLSRRDGRYAQPLWTS